MTTATIVDAATVESTKQESMQRKRGRPPRSAYPADYVYITNNRKKITQSKTPTSTTPEKRVESGERVKNEHAGLKNALVTLLTERNNYVADTDAKIARMDDAIRLLDQLLGTNSFE